MSTWVPATGARYVLVVDDEVFDDPRRRSILELSAMGAAEVQFVTVAKAAQLLSTYPTEAAALVLFSSLESVLGAIDHGLELRRVVIGHLPEGPERTPVHPAVHLGPSDHEAIDRLAEQGVEVVVQALPSDKAVPAFRFRPRAQSVPPPPRQQVSRRLRVVNAKGLHLRAAHLLAQLAGSLNADVHVGASTSRVNAKSLLGLATLGASCGTEVDVSVEGPGAADAMDQIVALFASGFEEGVDWSDEDPLGR